jgi:hypothetical protein
VTIAAEIAAGLAEAGIATGTGPLIVTFTRAATGEAEAVNPWDIPTETPPELFTAIAVDTGVRDRYVAATGITLRSRVLLVEASGFVPLKSDSVTVRGAVHEILEIEPVAPGGVDLMYRVHIEA